MDRFLKVALVSLLCMLFSVFQTQALKPAMNFAPENTVIAFDLHKVLMKQDFFKITMRLLKRNMRAGFLFFSPRFAADLRSCIKEGLIVEKVFEKMGSKYKQIKGVKQDLIEILNDQPLFDDSVAVLLELKQLGYKVFLLSNIAHDTFVELEKKRPEFISLFDGYYIPSPDNNYIRKPNPAFYIEFRKYLINQGHGNKKIIFIDDREKNIMGAGDMLHGILFRSARKLRKTLRKLGIPIVHRVKKKI